MMQCSWHPRQLHDIEFGRDGACEGGHIRYPTCRSDLTCSGLDSLSLDTFDSDSGKSHQFNIFRRQPNVVVLRRTGKPDVGACTHAARANSC